MPLGGGDFRKGLEDTAEKMGVWMTKITSFPIRL
jgi:hypothetical protein